MQSDPQAVSSVYEFFRYHVVGGFTFPNMVPMVFDHPNGANSRGLVFSTKFNKHKSVSTWIEGMCYDVFQDWMSLPDQPPVDVEVVLPFCHPHIFPMEEPYSMFSGPYSGAARCIDGRHSFEFVLRDLAFPFFA
jgi:hypothetical protein